VEMLKHLLLVVKLEESSEHARMDKVEVIRESSVLGEGERTKRKTLDCTISYILTDAS